MHSRLRRVLSIEVKGASTRTVTIKKEMYDVATDQAHNNIDTSKASQKTLISRYYVLDP